MITTIIPATATAAPALLVAPSMSLPITVFGDGRLADTRHQCWDFDNNVLQHDSQEMAPGLRARAANRFLPVTDSQAGVQLLEDAHRRVIVDAAQDPRAPQSCRRDDLGAGRSARPGSAALPSAGP
jgi:hypothetical protein